MTEPSSTSRVTKQDVLDALGETDPFKTNAGALRAKLGHGGNSTIQRLLNEIRSERSAPSTMPLDSDAIPPPAPVDLIESVWHVSWRYAQSQTLSRLDKVTSELSQLKETHALLSSDYDALCTDIDELRDTLKTQSDNCAELTEQLANLRAAHEGELSALRAAHEKQLLAQDQAQATKAAQMQADHQQVLGALAAAQAELNQERELVRRDMQLKDTAHKHDREYLLNQITELKTLLYRPQPTEAPVPVPAPVPAVQRATQVVPQSDLPLSIEDDI